MIIWSKIKLFSILSYSQKKDSQERIALANIKSSILKETQATNVCVAIVVNPLKNSKKKKKLRAYLLKLLKIL